jgi:hypothetical protein
MREPGGAVASRTGPCAVAHQGVSRASPTLPAAPPLLALVALLACVLAAALNPTDAAGRTLPARIGLHSRRLELTVDDRGASYSVTVDPFIADPYLLEGPKLTGGEESGKAGFGASVALSGDGNTALVGGPTDIPGPVGAGVGAAWVFTRSGSTWTQQGPKLTGAGGIGEGEFGRSVALSADGNTALIGGRTDNGGAGAAWVFKRTGSTWTQQGPKLLAPSSSSGEAGFGSGVALSGDGNTAILGGPFTNTGGAAWVFTRTGSSWAPAGEKLAGAGRFGEAIALSPDGSTAIVGAPFDGSSGTAIVFVRSGASWVQQGAKLAGEGATESGEFGSSVALSADGSTALVGAKFESSWAGSGWVFTRSGTTWKQQGGKLTTNEDGGGTLGDSVALSADGNAALIGEGGFFGSTGAAWVFTRSGTTWTPLEELKARDGGEASFGQSVALSADGNTALVGGRGDTNSIGAAWPFGHPLPAVVTGGAAAVAQRGATLAGTVNPNGGPVGECRVEYGTSATYGSRAPCSASPGTGLVPIPVSASIGGLGPHTTYHFRVAAANPAGAGYGGDQTFQTLPDPPLVATGSASSLGAYATLNATVNPNGGQLNLCRFEYGTSTSYDSEALCSTGAQAGEVAVGVFVAVATAAKTTYHFRLVASNAGGTAVGADRAFTTPAPPLPQVDSLMTWSFAWSRRYTIVRSLTVHGVPSSGRVEVSCRGHGCAFRRHRSAVVSRHYHRTRQGPTINLASLFKGRYLGVGARITVNVIRPGWVGKSFQFTTRAGHPPALKIVCLMPGSNRPLRC